MTTGIGWTALRFQVSDRVAALTVGGGPLTRPEIETLLAYLSVQETVAGEPVVSKAELRASDTLGEVN